MKQPIARNKAIKRFAFMLFLTIVCILTWRADGYVFQQVASLCFKLLVTCFCICIAFIWCIYNPNDNNMLEDTGYGPVEEKHIGGDSWY